MAEKLFLLDGMALVYRAHFAFMRNPMYNANGDNVSAIYGFTNALVDILQKQEPSHIAVAFDTSEPTERHKIYPEYKAQREAMPEDIQFALPEVEKLLQAFNVPVLKYPGYEADDVIGTLATQAEKAGYHTYMVTPDKDFAQLVSDNITMYKPGRQGGKVELIDVPTVNEQWCVTEPKYVADILGLWGDASDNIPGVPGVGEKTAKKLIAQYGSMEGIYEHTDELKGKQKEKVEANKEQAFLSKQLATINCEVPVKESLDELVIGEKNEEALKELFSNWEFNTLGKRVLGNQFKTTKSTTKMGQQDLFGLGYETEEAPEETEEAAEEIEFKTIETVKHEYQILTEPKKVKAFAKKLAAAKSFVFDLETESLDSRNTEIVGYAFSLEAHSGVYIPSNEDNAEELREIFRPVFLSDALKVGHNLKFDITVLKWLGVEVTGPLFDTMVAFFLCEPEQRQGMDYLAQTHLDYRPVSITTLIGEKKKDQISMREVPVETAGPYACEDTDITLQLWKKVEPMLKEKGQESIFYVIEMPLLSVLIDIEFEGINLNTKELAGFSVSLGETIQDLEKSIYEEAGVEFNLNSPKQLGEVLFDNMKLVEKPKKTKTGQYATNEQVLESLAPHHEIVKKILDYRGAAKLKSTYVDALPKAVDERTGRIHTSFSQTGAITGRLSSNNPNLQNIPIKTEMGQEIRKAFIPRDKDHVILAADYSQIELRVMASMSGDEGMKEAFEKGQDIHAATAAKIFDVPLDEVTREQRGKAKMVNFSIIYGISAFGLSQRLSIPRKEAAMIIDQYFKEYPGVKTFMDDCISTCQNKGYVETLSGRRRYIRDINSRNGTVKAAAERVAINSPIQGSAADMIKIAMTRVLDAMNEKGMKSRMLLQVHDELVFDAHKDEVEELSALAKELMEGALPLEVPTLVEIDTGSNWLEAH